MNRRAFIAALGGAAAGWPLAARAQQPARVWRIGMLDTSSQELNEANLAAFRRGLRELGYFEGQNLRIEYRTSAGLTGHLPDLVSELLRLKVDVIVLRGTQEAMAVKNATNAVPVVMSAVSDPIGSGFIASLARPGGNFTGLISFAGELATKNVELLITMVPTVKLLALVQDASNPATGMFWEEVQRAARTRGIGAKSFDVRNAADVSRAFDTASKDGVDAIYVNVDNVTRPNQRQIIELAAQYRLPAIYAAREFVDNGGLFTYAVSYPQLYFRAASFVDKIFRGVKPADLPVEQPTKFELVINMKSAKTLGLTVPPSLLAIADEVIE
jgi:putative ABC transport system substrate-binding protein